MNLEKIYTIADADYSEVIKTLPESLLPQLLKMFLDDKSMDNLEKAIAENNAEDAFRAIHTLKGVALNLHLDSLSKNAIELTEKLRDRKLENYEAEYHATLSEYQKIIDAINEN